MKKISYILILLNVFYLISCNQANKTASPSRIFYVNSYQAGYGSSDDVMKGITETLANENVALKTFFLNAKQKNSEAEIQESVKSALLEITNFKPDLLIVSDDNAVKDLVVPHFNNAHLPVVFCGVNWSANQYNLGENVTGMLEVLPLKELLSELIKNYPETKKMVVLSENSLSEQNNKTILDTLYRNLGLEPTYSLADDFETWKTLFMKANQEADLIYMPINGAIKNWDETTARTLIENNLKIPAVTCDDFMMPYTVFGLTKVAKEQGEWASKTAIELLGGKKPAEIPISRNKKTKAWINTKLAAKIDFKVSEEIKRSSTQL